MFKLGEPIRVLNLFSIMNRGGAETMVMNYYRNLEREKVQFDFMVHRQEKGAYDDEIIALGGNIYRMPAIRPWTSVEYRRCIRQFYHDHTEYKIVHAHMSELGYYDFIEAQKAGVPIRICHAHNRPLGIDMKSPVRWYYKNRMLPHITHMFTCGEESGEWLFGRRNNSKFIQLNNAIDAEIYRYNKGIRAKMRMELALQGKLVIGHVGRFCRQKNHTFIVDIFKEVCLMHEHAILILIGDGEERARIEQKIYRNRLQEKVLFLGIRSDISDLLQAMDVFLLPSLFEGLSVASVEAQAAGLPVLISDKTPIECKKTDLVYVESLGSSPIIWAQRILELSILRHRDTYKDIKDNGFDIKENAKWLQEFYINAASEEEDLCLC